MHFINNLKGFTRHYVEQLVYGYNHRLVAQVRVNCYSSAIISALKSPFSERIIQ